ncbi:MAG: 30S ribosomal protein S3 [Gammaproteobacteria bacterium]|nr:30S ribosomal protein S3 [Gammaproteobacteria bacterium]
MGQKVNPLAIRLGINKESKSKWFVNNKNKFAKTIIEDKKIRDWLKKELSAAGVGEIIIERQNNKAGVVINAARPGVVIGKKGEDVERLKKAVSKIAGVPVQISIQEIKKPELHSQLVAETIAQQLEKRVMFRRAMKRAVSSTLRLGAKGIKVCVSGRLGGAEIARTEWYREGRVPLHTFRADIDYGTAEALTTYGIIGVKVWIYKGDVLAKTKSQNEEELAVNQA